MRVVSTVKFGWSAGDMAQRSLANFAAGHPVLWVSFRAAWWFVVHPLHTLGMALFVWLWASGWPWFLAMPVGALVPAVRVIKGWLTVLPSPSRGKAPLKQAWVALRRWRVLRRSWPEAAFNAGLTAKGNAERFPRLLRARATDTGLSATIACGRVGIPADKVAKVADVLSASIKDCRAVTVTPGRTPGFAHLNFMWADPLGKVVTLDRLPLPPKGKLSYGLTEAGRAATIDKYLSLLVVGETGSGKSGVLWALLASALADGIPFRLRVIDPKGGVELFALKDGPLVREYCKNPADTGDLIDRAHRAMMDRMDRMGGNTRFHTPTDKEPWEILVIDEFLSLNPKQIGVGSKLGQILQMGRAASFNVWALTQVGQIDALGRLRNMIPQRLVLRTDSDDTTDAVLGKGAESRGARCSKIRANEQGMGYASIDGIPGLTKFRTAWVPDELTYLIGQGHLPDMVPVSESVKLGKGPLENMPHVLYAWHNQAGDLLYVGISNNGQRRAMQHVANKPWASEPGVTMQIMEKFDTRTAALAAEKEAIQTLHPRYNIEHNGAVALQGTVVGG